MIINRTLFVYFLIIFIVAYMAFKYFGVGSPVNEYMTVSEDALSTIASVYNTGNLTANTITATQSLTSNGAINCTAGNITSHGDLIATGNVYSGNTYATGQSSVGGPSAGMVFNDRTTNNNPWQWYSTGGPAYLYNGGNKLTINQDGSFYSGGSLNASTVTNTPALAVTGSATIGGTATAGMLVASSSLVVGNWIFSQTANGSLVLTSSQSDGKTPSMVIAPVNSTVGGGIQFGGKSGGSYRRGNWSPYWSSGTGMSVQDYSTTLANLTSAMTAGM